MNLNDFNLEKQNSIPLRDKSLLPNSLVDKPNPQMPLLDAICTRRTSRSYDPKPVPFEVFQWVVKHASHAPTACNEQRWKIIYIDDPKIIYDLYERGSASFLKNIKQCFIVCYNNQTDNLEWKDHIQSGAAFINTWSLLAHSIGIGSCWVGHLPNKSELKRVFSIHTNYEPISLVTFGFYRAQTRMLERKKSIDQLIYQNKFDSKGLSFETERGTLKRTILRYIYYKLPAIIRRKLKPYTTKYEKKFYYEIFD
jgi:nitroreductase